MAPPRSVQARVRTTDPSVVWKPSLRKPCQAVEKPLGQAKRRFGEQAAAAIPPVCTPLFFGQAAVRAQVGTLNRAFQQPDNRRPEPTGGWPVKASEVVAAPT